MTRVGRRALLGAAAAPAAWLAGWPIAGATPTPAPRPDDLAIARALPGLAGRLPRAGLWPAPAPVKHARTLSATLSMPAGLWLARDDLAGTVIAGGKARKLDLLLGEAIATGAREVASTGGTGSNHARSVAVSAAELGLGARLALLPEPASPEVTRNLDAIRAAGAAVRVGGRDGVARLAAEARASGGRTAWIPMGGTSPVADLAFASAALEIVERARRGAMPLPATVVTALGSGGSAVGLALGFALAGVPTRVVAVRCSSPGTSSRGVVDAELHAVCALLRRLDPSAPDRESDARARLAIEGGELGRGYARPTARSARAAAMLLDEEGVRVDPTYGAKAAAYVVRAAASSNDGPVLLWIGSDARWLAAGAHT